MAEANEFNEIHVERVSADFERGARAMLEWVQLRTGDGLRDVLLDERDRLDRGVPR